MEGLAASMSRVRPLRNMTVMPHDDVTRNDTPDLVGASPEPGEDEAELVEEEILVEEISIDGMCGVY